MIRLNRFTAFLCVIACATGTASGQLPSIPQAGQPVSPPPGQPTAAPTGQPAGATNWQSRGVPGQAPAATSPQGGFVPQVAPTPRSNLPRTRIARVTSGTDVLPRSAGQVWRNYDITPFTKNYPAESHPEREIIDWILRETGTDLWFSEPLGILSATHDTLRVYHSPEVQSVVHDIVDRFVDPNANSLVLTFSLVTVGNPNWRSRMFSMMQPVQVQSDGLQGWLVSKENAAVMLGELNKRNDFQQLQGPSVFIPSGRTEILTRTRPVNFVQGIVANPANPGAAMPANDSVNEGFALEISALKAVEGDSMEAVVKVHVNQLEKLQNVPIDLANPFGQPQRTQIQVPQMVNWRIHERFKWPANQVLVLSCGVVATPGPSPQGLFPLPKMLDGSAGRADALLLLEVKRSSELTAVQPGGVPGTIPGNVPRNAVIPSVNSNGRY